MSARDGEDTYAIRAVLEGLAARQAAENLDPSKGPALRAILAEVAQNTSDHRVYHEVARAVLRRRMTPAPGKARPGNGSRRRSTSRRRG